MGCFIPTFKARTLKIYPQSDIRTGPLRCPLQHWQLWLFQDLCCFFHLCNDKILLCVSYDRSQWPVPGSVFSWMSSTQVDTPTQMTAQGGPPPCCLKVGQICPLSAHLNTLCFGSMAKSRDWPQEQICSEAFGSKSCFYPKIGEATSGRTTKNNKASIVHLGQIWMSDRIGNGEISLSVGRANIALIRNQATPAVGFVKLLRPFVFISLIISSMILHVTIVTPRRC